MKVRVQFEQRVNYTAEIEMTKEAYDEWCTALDTKRGQSLRDAHEALFELCHFDTGTGDYDDPICETFESVPAASADGK